MRKPVSERIMSVAERQMRRWELSFEVHERIEKEQATQRIPFQVHPYISISREAGARASEIAALIKEELGLELLDKELLDYMGTKYNLSKGMLEFLDEEECSWLGEVFGRWLDQRLVTQSEYVTHLGQIILLTARSSSAIFVGRGAHFFLPREKGLLILVVAPLDKRVERIRGERQLSAEDARSYAEERDKGRRDFIRRYFHRDITDPHLYDLVINTESFSSESAARLVVEEYRRRFSS